MFLVVPDSAAPWTHLSSSPPGSSVHEFSRQEYWRRGCHFLEVAWDLTNPGIEPPSPTLPAGFFTTSASWEAPNASHSIMSNSLQPHGLYPARLLCPWNSPGKNTGSGFSFPSPGDFPDPELVTTVRVPTDCLLWASNLTSVGHLSHLMLSFP